MKILVTTIFILYSIFGIALAGTKEYCANKWSDDYQMREYCAKQQINANQELFSIAESKGLIKNGTLSTSPSGGDYEKIVNRCMNKWKNRQFKTYDFTMVVYCIKQQFESYEKVSPNKGSGKNTGIEGYCANKWPDDYQMREYCAKQQINANQELFSIAESKGLIKNGTLSTSPSGGDYEKIVNRCMNKWKNRQFKTYDFTMVVYCIKQQFSAYKRME